MAQASFSPLPSELTPTAERTVTTGNYIDFQASGFSAWTQQHLPELYEQEVERYGNRMISSILKLTAAEEALASDQVIWQEQSRLHLAYRTVTAAADSAGANVLTVNDSGGHSIRKNQVIKITDGTNTALALVTVGQETSTTTLTVKAYGSDTGLVDAASISTGANACKILVIGSEFGKGTDGMKESVSPTVHTFSNKPIIIKDNFSVSGSDATQIGWIEISGEAGQSGYMWYLKAEGDTRSRFEDYLEMMMVESEQAADSAAATNLGVSGTQGFFSALTARGINASNVFDDAADVISDYDLLLKELDKQAAIPENMQYLDRSSSIAIDNGLATANSYGSGGTSYGLFDNSEDMALNLGFSGFRRGGYDFYKSDWKYLNDEGTRGLFSDVKGVLIPAGSTNVYDETLGKHIRRPYLHVRYRATEAENRKMKSWIVGSVGGVKNSTVDDMNVQFLSERCLVVQAANNFVQFI